jgi:peptidyl-dipeptidase Dcp
VAAIADNPEPPTFANTIEALELADERLGRVLGVFYPCRRGHERGARRLQREFSPKLAAYSSEVSMNRALFARIEALWEARDSLGLTRGAGAVLMLTRRGFVRAGAQLEGAARDRLKAVKERLAVLGTAVHPEPAGDERDWAMDLSEADLEGLPGFVVAAARSAGEEKGRRGRSSPCRGR